jgi:hypothetical protein
MPLRTLLLMIVLLLGVGAGPAAAENHDKPKWGEGGSWDIYVDTNAGDVCYAVRGFRGGIGMLVAVLPDGGLFFRIAGDSWHFAEAGETYLLKFVFGNDSTYEEELEGVAMESAVALSTSRMSAAFLTDFMEATSLLVYHQGSLIAPVLLLDTYDSVTQLRTCNASVAGMPDDSDPSLR